MSPTAAVVLLVGTRRGAFICHGEAGRRNRHLDSPHFLGCIANRLVLDPRDGRMLLLAARTGHLGPTVFRSDDPGRNRAEAKQPPPSPARRWQTRYPDFRDRLP